MGADRFVEAERAYQRACDLAPRRGNTFSALAMALLAQGRSEEALKAATREPHEAWRDTALAIVHHAAGHRAASDEALRNLAEKFGETMAYQVAEAHAARGEADAAFEWLEQARSDRDSGLAMVKTNYRFRPLHGDPRWKPFLAKVGFAA